MLEGSYTSEGWIDVSRTGAVLSTFIYIIMFDSYNSLNVYGQMEWHIQVRKKERPSAWLPGSQKEPGWTVQRLGYKLFSPGSKAQALYSLHCPYLYLPVAIKAPSDLQYLHRHLSSKLCFSGGHKGTRMSDAQALPAWSRKHWYPEANLPSTWLSPGCARKVGPREGELPSFQ